MENKLASLLVVSLGNALNEMPPSLYGRPVAEPSVYLSYRHSLIEDLKTEHELLRSVYVDLPA